MKSKIVSLIALSAVTLLSHATGTLGFYAINTANHQVIAQHAKQRFPFCSTGKLMVIATILKQSESKPGLLNQHITFDQKTLTQSGYAPVTSKHLQTGMTVEQLCAAAIEYSDNAAANLLIKQLGGSQVVTQFARSIGNKSFRLDRTEPQLNTAIPGDPRDTSTPKDMAQSLKRLVLGDVLASKQRALLKTWLIHNTTGKNRIRAGVTKSWIVGDKTGTGQYGTTNDIAVIWPPKRKPIILAIYFTQKSKSAKPNDQVISRVAKHVLNKV